MDRRSEPRIPVELPIRIWGVDSLSRPFSEVARVKNVSEDGAILEGVQSKLKAGEILDVQYGPYRASFKLYGLEKRAQTSRVRLDLSDSRLSNAFGISIWQRPPWLRATGKGCIPSFLPPDIMFHVHQY